MPPRLRPPAVPLVANDPYFSTWSCTDRLFDAHPRHWTMSHRGMTGLIRVDGVTRRFLGRALERPQWQYRGEPSGMEQKSVDVRALSSVYLFEGQGVALTAQFTSPLLPDDPDILSRPFSYVTLKARSADGAPHAVQIYLDVTGEWCVDRPDQPILWHRRPIAEDVETLAMGTWSQNVLGHRGDDVRIDWGYVHLLAPESTDLRIGECASLRGAFSATGSIAGDDLPTPPRGQVTQGAWPALAATWDIRLAEEAPRCCTAILGYDDIRSIEYFGRKLKAYCFREGASFDEVAGQAVAERQQIINRCDEWDSRVRKEAEAVAGSRYADLTALAFRQSIAAHKLVADEDGTLLFFSKECFSNGSIGTVDVSYPSTPLYLLYNPELVAGMLRPVLRFAASGDWPVEYAPHDVGNYPRANGQFYGVTLGKIDPDKQMPVEECGNMLIMMAAYSRAAGSDQLAQEYWTLLEQWAKYLTAKGYDPAQQLCTDDFAGHLAHNTNLSIKAILGIACFADLCTMTGRAQEAHRYRNIARELAARWQHEADDGNHTRLTFADADTWSLKYNLVWDQLMGFDLFAPEVAEREVAWYKSQKNRYGTPLDSRAAFTKTDWLVWAASLAKDRGSLVELMDPIWDFANETPSRTPFTDFYDSLDACEQSMHHRSVIGGIFMPLLKAKMVEDWPQD